MTVIEKVGNPAQALSEGAEKLKEAVGNFFGSIKTKVKEISGSIKEKATLLGQPAQLIKTIANKAVDMVLNFIITHPPSALIKAVFKGIEAIAGKSIVELIRQYIPYADKILDKIAGSGPVQGIMKPLEGPVKTVGGMIDQVTDQTTGMVDSAERTTLSSMGSGAKLMTAMGIGGQSKNESKAGDKETGQAQGDSKGGSKSEGGGDFFGTVRSGIHNNLMTLGLINLKKLGMQILAAGAAKISGAIRKMLTPKVKFKLGSETHELWVEQDKTRNSVMMASGKGEPFGDQLKRRNIPNDVEVIRDQKEAEAPENEKIAEPKVRNLAETTETVASGHKGKDGSKGKSNDKEGLAGESEANDLAAKLRSNPSTYYSYDELHSMIKQAGLSGSNAGFEAHHLLAKQFAGKFGVQQGEIISVALTPKWHRGSGGEKLIAEGKNINDVIEKQLKTITGSSTQRGAVSSATPEQVWQAHRVVYEGMGQNSWAKAVYDKYISPLGIPYK